MTATLSSWGNSQGLRFPKEILKELHLSIGDKLNISIENQKIIIEPIKKRKKYSIDELVAKMPKDYRPSEELSDRVGQEEW